MATETPETGASESEFGEVSRLKGVAFEYISLGASLVGIVSLAALLAFVTFDAFGLGAADPAWFLVYFLTLVAPTTAFAWYGYRNRAVGHRSLGALFRLYGGTAAGIAVVILFVIFDVQLWVLVYTLGIVPAAGLAIYASATETPAANLGALVAGVIGFVGAVVLKGPLNTFPTDALIYLWSIGVPIAAYYGYRAHVAFGRERGLGAAAAALVGIVATGIAVGSLTGFGTALGVVFGATLVVPTGAYVVSVVEDGEGVIGVLLPVVIVAGALLGAFLVGVLGIAQPETWVDWQYVTSPPIQVPEQAGIYPAIIGSVFLITNVAVLTLVFGVGTAVYLEEYAPSSGILGSLTRLVRINISNLAGVPSVVYGLLGLGIFVNLIGLPIGVVVVAAVTLSLLILPIVIVSAQEAIQAVPDELRQASYGMGATRWQTIRNVVLPRAVPGILTGTILALGRAIGETAPLILIGAATSTFAAPTGFLDTITAMPMQIYAWSAEPSPEFRYGVVAAGVVILLVALLTINSIAIVVRNTYQTET